MGNFSLIASLLEVLICEKDFEMSKAVLEDMATSFSQSQLIYLLTIFTAAVTKETVKDIPELMLIVIKSTKIQLVKNTYSVIEGILQVVNG